MVTVNSITSDLVTVPCGIPQGSVLGPILFLLYINDFHKCSSLFDFHLFADDANLFYRHRDIAILRQHINTELQNVNRWLCFACCLGSGLRRGRPRAGFPKQWLEIEPR